MSLTFADPNQLWLAIPDTVKTSAWEASKCIQPPGGRWQVYLNLLCIHTCLPWLRSEVDHQATVFPELDANPISWEIVTGSRFELGDRTLVVIPHDTLGHDELQVPQAWVDLPPWRAHYYLAAKVNPSENWIEIWGYTAYQQLKEEGDYDTLTRCYSLDTLHSNIPALWAIIERATIERASAAQTQASREREEVAFSALSPAQAERLIAQLASPEVAFPRLSVPFAQWGALLAHLTWRQQLYHQRLANLQAETLPTDALDDTVMAARGSGRSALRQGAAALQGAIAEGWQSIESIFGREATQLAFSFRQSSPADEIREAKNIQLGPDDNPCAVRLVMLWRLEADGRLTVQAQLYPAEGELHLAEGITFALISQEGEVLQSIQSAAENNYIQLKRFKCPANYVFQLKLQLAGQTIIERMDASLAERRIRNCL